METGTTSLLKKSHSNRKMRSFLCCLSKHSEEKDVVVDVLESIKSVSEETSRQQPSGHHRGSDRKNSDGGDSYINADEGENGQSDVNTYKTTDKGVSRLDTYKSRSEISSDARRSLSSRDEKISESTSTVTSSRFLTPMYPAREIVSGEDTLNPAAQNEPITESVRSKEERTSNKSGDSLAINFSKLFRRLARPAKWSVTKTTNIELSTFNDECGNHKRRNQLDRQVSDHRSRGEARTNTRTYEEQLPLKISEVSEVPLEPSLPVPVLSYVEPDLSSKKVGFPEGLDYLKVGQGDAFRIPSHVMYAPPIPGEHYRQPQVFPVFSWSVPVHRTRLEEGGVSFTFGGGSTQPSGTMSDGQPANTQIPNPFISTLGTGTCPQSPTPMDVDEPLPSDTSLLNHLVQLTSTSTSVSDNQQQLQQQLQQLREDMQTQLQLQQQLLQHQSEARTRQLGETNASEATPSDHVLFCEWTLVLQYDANQKVSDRPMGVLGHEPLRNYELRRRSDSHPDNDPNSRSDIPCGPSSEPNTHNSEPLSVYPKQEPVKPEPDPEPVAEPAPVCPKPETSKPEPEPVLEPAPVCPKPETIKPEPEPEPVLEPAPVCPKPETIKPEPEPEPGQSEPAPLCPQSEPMKSEIAPVEAIGNEPEKQSIQNEPSERKACVKKSKSKTVRIKQEQLDDNYDVF